MPRKKMIEVRDSPIHGKGVFALREIPRGTISRTQAAVFVAIASAAFVAVCWLLLDYYSPSVAGLAGCLIALSLSLFQGRYRPSARQLGLALEEGLEMMALLALLLIAIGPMGQAFLTTNLSGRLGTYLVAVLPDNSFILLAGAAVLSLILGMGLPTPVAYLIASLAVVPFVIQINTPPLLAHYFVFYFAVYATLSPWERVNVARHADRPMTTDYVQLMLDDFVELHGDKFFGDDRALRTGFAKLDRYKVLVVGHYAALPGLERTLGELA